LALAGRTSKELIVGIVRIEILAGAKPDADNSSEALALQH
jgi:hypothetical protein